MKSHIPKRRVAWLVFDLSNGHRGAHRYVWWFDTKRDALEHIRDQRLHRWAADLSDPVRYERTP